MFWRTKSHSPQDNTSGDYRSCVALDMYRLAELCIGVTGHMHGDVTAISKNTRPYDRVHLRRQ